MDWNTLIADKDTSGSIKDWVNHAILPVEDIVREAEKLIFKRLRVTEMRTLLTGSLAQDDETIDISAQRFLSPLQFRFIGNYAQRVTLRKPEMFEASRFEDEDGALERGTPTDYMHDRNTIYLNCKAEAAMSYRIWFYQQPEPLSDSNNENLLTTDYPEILRQACLWVAYDYRKDRARRDEAAQQLSALIGVALVDSDMADETAQYDIHWGTG